jgi:hypothetical protein
MVKALLALCAAAFLAAPSTPASAPYDHDPAAIVRVQCITQLGTRTGSGVRIAPDTYITAAHVVVESGECSIAGVPITVTFSDEPSDFAMFSGGAAGPTMPVHCGGFKAERVYLARGFAFGGNANFGMPWQATEITDNSLRLFIGDAIPGMSGGPVIDRKGRVAGIVNMRLASRGLPLSATKVCREPRSAQ